MGWFQIFMIHSDAFNRGSGVANGADGTFQFRGVEDAMHSYAQPTTIWRVKACLDRWAIMVDRMAQSVGNAIGSAWITVMGVVCAAGIIAMVGFVISSQVAITRLSEQQTVMRDDMRDMKGDIREIRGIVSGNRTQR